MEEHGMQRWAQKVAFVTGASSGVGRAVAYRLAAEGMRVVAVARRSKRLDGLLRDVTMDELPGEMMVLQVDLLDEDQILAAFRSVRERWGGVDVLVNAAGHGHLAPLLSGRTEHWREMLELNVISLSVCTREAVQDMLRRNVAGHVIHISAMAAHRVPTDGGVYSASKFAVRALTEALRQELRAIASPIRVSSISPGFIETEFAEHYHKRKSHNFDFYQKYEVLKPEDLADAVCFSLSAPAYMQVHDMLIRPLNQPQ